MVCDFHDSRSSLDVPHGFDQYRPYNREAIPGIFLFCFDYFIFLLGNTDQKSMYRSN